MLQSLQKTSGSAKGLGISLFQCSVAFGLSGVRVEGFSLELLGYMCVCVRVFVDHVPMYLCFDLVISDKTSMYLSLLICLCTFVYVFMD